MTIKTYSSRAALAALAISAGALLSGSASGAIINLAGVTIAGNPADADGQAPVTGSVGGTAVFARNDLQTSGTGAFNPFLIIQNDGSEQGYNTDGTLTMDTKQTNFTRNVQVGELKIVTVSGQGATPFYEFILDANQNANDTDGKATLSLNSLILFTSPTASISETSLSALDLRGDTTERFNLGQNEILIDAGLGSTAGSGSADLFAFIPVSAFTGALPTDYLYFYNQNGVGLRASNDGSEEWRALTGANPVPEGGATVALFGLALGCMGLFKKGYRKNS